MTIIKDVARLAEISTATVSRVINEARYASEELRVWVLEAMETLDDRPNFLSKGASPR